MMTMDCRYDCKVSNKMQNKYLKIVKMICFLENLDLSAAPRQLFRTYVLTLIQNS